MRILICSTIAFFLCVPQSLADTWVDDSGKYAVEAEFVSLREGIVRLKRNDGRVIDLPLDKLNAEGRDRVKKLAAAEAKPPTKRTDKVNSADEVASKIEAKASAEMRRGMRVSRDGTKTPYVDLVVNLDFMGELAKDAVEVGFLSIDSATANSEPIKRDREPPDFDIAGKFKKIGRFDYERLDNGCRLPIKFIASDETTGPVAISGSLKLKTGGAKTTVTIDDPTRIKGLVDDPKLQSAGAAVEIKLIKSRTVHYLEVLVQEEFKDGCIKSIKLFDGSGKEMRVGSLGGVTSRGTKMRRYNIEFREHPPRDLKLQLPLRTDLKVLTVPFRVEAAVSE